MARKASQVQMATILLDGQVGWIGVFSSEPAAQRAAEALESHVGRKLDVLPAPFWYDDMSVDDMGVVLDIIKPQNGS